VKSVLINKTLVPTALVIGTWMMVGSGTGGKTEAAEGLTTTAVAEGYPPSCTDLSPGQRRLMAKRAAEVRAIRDALSDTLGAPPPSSIRDGQIAVGGRIAGFRIVESQELPDGRWRAGVEVTMPPDEAQQPTDPVSVVLTDYLQFRSAMLASRERCRRHEARLQQRLNEPVESIRSQVDAQLRACQADIAVIDRALADLEERTTRRLGLSETTSSPAPHDVNESR